MKKILVFTLICLAVSPAFAEKKKSKAKSKTKTTAAATSKEKTIQSLPLGSQIPSAGLALQSVKGDMVSLDQAKTPKGLLVMFSCNTCPYVIKSEKRTADMIALAKELGVGMVVLNSNEAKRGDDDSYEAMKQYGYKVRYDIPYLRDDASMLADQFGATHTPEVFLFDGNGKLVYKGAMEDNPAEPEKSKQLYLSVAMKAMVNSQPITTAETKSIGCGIKRLNM